MNSSGVQQPVAAADGGGAVAMLERIILVYIYIYKINIHMHNHIHTTICLYLTLTISLLESIISS